MTHQTLELFELRPSDTPSLRTLIEAGDAGAALRYVERIPFEQACHEATQSGFWIAGSKRDRATFYRFLGKQLLEACRRQSRP